MYVTLACTNMKLAPRDAAGRPCALYSQNTLVCARRRGKRGRKTREQSVAGIGQAWPHADARALAELKASAAPARRTVTFSESPGSDESNLSEVPCQKVRFILKFVIIKSIYLRRMLPRSKQIVSSPIYHSLNILAFIFH